MTRVHRRRGVAALAAGLALLVGVPAVAARAPWARPAPRSAPLSEPAPVAPTGVGDVTGLSPAMRRSVARAVAAAAESGVELRVTSGWRSRDHQAALFAAAVRKYGTETAARRWVLPPEESAHVTGEAVDVGPPAAALWLERHGVRFGLCRRYDNEPWHFERLAGELGSRCPARQAHA